jgi:hypothetical protein
MKRGVRSYNATCRRHVMNGVTTNFVFKRKPPYGFNRAKRGPRKLEPDEVIAMLKARKPA